MRQFTLYLMAALFLFFNSNIIARDEAESVGAKNYLLISPLIRVAMLRTYYLARLQKVALLFDTISSKNLESAIKPFFKIWNDFRAFRFIEDKSLTGKLVEQAYISLQGILRIKKQPDAIFHIKDSLYGLELIAAQIDAIDHMVDSIKGEKNYFLNKQGFDSILNDINKLHPNNIVIRFYFTKRLEKIITFMHFIENQKYSIADIFEDEKAIFSITECKAMIEHPCILSMFEQIIQTNSLLQILCMWRCIQYYYYIADDLLFKDFLIVLCALVGNFIVNHSPDETLLHFVDLPVFDTLQDLKNEPIERLLVCISVMEKRFEIIAKRFQSRMKWYQRIINWLFYNKKLIV